VDVRSLEFQTHGGGRDEPSDLHSWRKTVVPSKDDERAAELLEEWTPLKDSNTKEGDPGGAPPAAPRSRWLQFVSPTRIPGLVVLIGAAILALKMGLGVDRADIRGWEAHSIASNIAAGHGFSNPAPGGWLTDELDHSDQMEQNLYVATAWVDPVYTYTLALLMRSLGDWYDIGAIALNLILFVFVVFMTYRVAGSLSGKTAGLVASLVVATTFVYLAPGWLSLMNNTMMASALILLFAYQLQGTLGCATPRRGVVLGLVLGLTVLGVPSAVLFLPLVALAIIVATFPNWRAGLMQSIVVTILALLVISPWAIRNYIEFDELVLVRTGSGQIAFIGTVAVTATVAPDLIRSEVKPEWSANSVREAVFRAASPDGRRSLERQYQMQYARELGGTEFHSMNEAQRDEWFMNETRMFIADNPVISAELAFWKLRLFITRLGLGNALLAIVAAIAGAVALIRWRLVTLTFALAVFVYSFPFALIITYVQFERYRLPIEPLLIIVATAGAWEFARSVRSRWPRTPVMPFR